MKSLRMLWVVLMSVAIPVNGLAAAPVSPCPMQAPDYVAVAGIASASPDDADTMMDCCKDMQHGQGKCKPGQSCGLGGIFFVLPVAFQFYLPITGITLARYTPPYFSEQIASIWHPPQVLTL